MPPDTSSSPAVKNNPGIRSSLSSYHNLPVVLLESLPPYDNTDGGDSRAHVTSSGSRCFLCARPGNVLCVMWVVVVRAGCSMAGLKWFLKLSGHCVEWKLFVERAVGHTVLGYQWGSIYNAVKVYAIFNYGPTYNVLGDWCMWFKLGA